MKNAKLVLGSFLALSFSVSFTACSWLWDEVATATTSFLGIEDTSSGEDESDSTYVKHLGDSESITLSGVNGKIIMYANFNKASPDDSSSTYNDNMSIPTSYQRYVTDSSGITSVSSSQIVTYTSSSTRSIAELESDSPKAQIRHFIPPKDIPTQDARSVSATAPLLSVTNNSYSDFTVGTSTKTFYVDNDYNISTFVQKSATLRGKASYDGGGVLVWVVDSNYTSSSSGNQVSANLAQTLADCFAKYSNHERGVFGSESDDLYTSSGTKVGSMSSYSETGNLVNIIIYDIGNDYGNNSSQTSGVVGYFYAKDYLTNASYSNLGKYFYIDAAYCNYNESKSDYSGNSDKPSGTVISTLFHEFQHMINFNQKNILNDVSPAAWYNEMLSMLSEDMMYQMLSNGGFSPESPAEGRLPVFNCAYFYSGIDEYLPSPYSAYSYSTAYAFGAYIARAFGGSELVKKISQNSSVDMTSILNAISAQTGKSYSERQLFKEYLQACVFRTDFSSEHSLPTFNKEGDSLTANGYTSVMNAIDLFSTTYSPATLNSKYAFTGPVIWKNGAQTGTTLRPHGFNIHLVGQASQDTVTLTFSSKQAANEDVVIYIQDSFSNSN